MSWAGGRRVLARWTAVLGLLAGSAAVAQYPGHVTKPDKPAPVLRAVSVLEWTGEAGKPSASRLVPVTVYDGEQLNDGNIYLTEPEPMALANGVEYELQEQGKPVGYFDVFGAGEHDGSWRGFGTWKPLTAKAERVAKAAVNTSSLYAGGAGADDEHPVLKRKHPKDTDGDSGPAVKSAPADGQAGAGTNEPVDPERPTLHRKSSSGSAGDSSTQSAGGTGDVDPERPTLHRSRRTAPDEAGMAETSVAEPDPDRPRLKRGKPADLGASEAPKLEGLPPTLEQAVAVSDGASRAEHPWRYSWADPADEEKMKSALEAMARKELGLDASAPAKTVRKGGKRAAAKPVEAAIPVDLADESFRVFELAYGSPATMVLSAATPVSREEAGDGVKAAPRKYVTLIAQPDLYGGVLVLTKSVTDARHLDETPQMRLVDAVDAMGDNRAELLFELRGDGQRQFALYRVLRGSAEQMFATVEIP